MRELPEGYTVEYEHWRRRLSDGARVLANHPAAGMETDTVDPRGGKTVARVLDGDGAEVAVGEALCLDTDNYDRRVGRAIALGRALLLLQGSRRKRVVKHARLAREGTL